METVILTLTVFLVVVLIMSVGVLFKGKPITGSCGGIANLMGSCDVCAMKSECVDRKKQLKEEDCSSVDCHS